LKKPTRLHKEGYTGNSSREKWPQEDKSGWLPEIPQEEKTKRGARFHWEYSCPETDWETTIETFFGDTTA